MTELGDGTCGSVSICSIYEYFKIKVSSQEVLDIGRDGKATNKYPNNGSSIIGIALASSTNENIRVDVYSSHGNNISDIETHLAQFEKPIAEEIKKKSNIFFHNSISIDEILTKVSNKSIPIIQFCRNGDCTKGHSSPLIGANGGKFLLLPVWDADGEITVEKEEFDKVWWLDKSCVFLTYN